MQRAQWRVITLSIVVICTLLVGNYLVLPFMNTRRLRREKMVNLPQPPSGYKWVPFDALSDEFDGVSLDDNKWKNYHPYWDGRIPSQFDRQNVRVQNGLLHLKSTTDIDNIDAIGDPETDIWVSSACVSSKEPSAFYGYYETRMKASSLSMTSSFWFQGKYSEIDVVEQLGAPRNHPERSMTMLMNTHYYPDGWESDIKTPVTRYMKQGAADDFHIYGIWWIDERTIWYYHNGEKVAEVKTGGAFKEPMYLFFDTEVFIWEGLPEVDTLKDSTKNTMVVDWVRSWKLVEK